MHPNERFKGPERTQPLWTNITADYQDQTPWTYSGQEIDMEGTAKKCDKCYRAFWNCKCTSGETWGLKLRVVNWTYIMVIRSIMTYGSAVWWLRVTYNVSRLQILACLATTGCDKDDPQQLQRRSFWDFLLLM